MPEEERDKVTGRFYRVDASRQHHGSGLGLSLVQAIADYHNAELTLADNAPGLRVDVAFSQ
jgi:signal transduction histidine kinase